MLNSDEIFLQRAIELAENGIGQASPNPMVGCVVVHNGKIIGEGWHEKYGQAHAEVNAINSVINKELLAQSTIYVNLEPCCHFGKTPPCTDMLISHRIKRVVLSNEDPFPAVNGGGIQKLKDAGIQVLTGVLKDKGFELNRRFFSAVQRKRPYVILKWAETADGFVALPYGKSLTISGELATKYNHKWRTEEDAILVGTQTVINDNPRLTARHWSGRSPVRVVLDPGNSIAADANVTNNEHITYIFTEHPLQNKEKLFYFPVIRDSTVVQQLLSKLYQEGIHSIIVEGGPRLHALFIASGNYDEVRILSHKTLSVSTGLKATPIPNGLKLLFIKDLKTDILKVFRKKFQPFE